MPLPEQPTRIVALFREALDLWPIYGLVVAESEALVLLQRVSDRYDLDGYEAFRREDITEIEDRFDRLELIRTALELKSLCAEQPSGLDLSSVAALMKSAQAQFGVLVISRERITDDEVEVGSIRLESAAHYVLRWLDTNAVWSHDDRHFRFADVTRVGFGGEYEQTLVRVAEAHAERGQTARQPD